MTNPRDTANTSSASELELIAFAEAISRLIAEQRKQLLIDEERFGRAPK